MQKVAGLFFKNSEKCNKAKSVRLVLEMQGLVEKQYLSSNCYISHVEI